MIKKLLIAVTFGLIINYSFAQQKVPLIDMPIRNNSPLEANYRIGCSLFTDPNNYTTGSSFSYNAPVNNNSNLIGAGNTNYGCLYYVPNQAWFIITVNSGGNLYFNFSNSNGYDVDAAIWGPIGGNDVANACNTTQNYPQTCDYDTGRPDLYINNAQAGQKYVMLVTNYSNANTVINISQPTGGNVTYSMVNLPNCSLTPSASISGTSTTITEGQSATLTLNFSGSSPWNYTLSDGTIGTSFVSPLNITVYPTASQTYTVNSVNNLCGTSGGSGSVGISVVRNVQLKSCFPLDGSATDSQGINSGSLQNGVLSTTNRSSEANKALQFDGIDDYVNIPTNQLNNNTFAFSAWVKLSELPNSGNPERLALSLGSTGEQHYLGVEYTNGSPAWKFYSNGVTVYGGATVNTDWHLLVAVRTGGQLKLYVDGSLSGTANTSGSAVYDSPLFGRIGSGIANNKFFKGKIDDVKIFNGSLIEPEILLLQNYNSCSNVYNDTFISVQSVSTSVICTGTSFIVRAFTNNLPIENDLQFVAELSDATGSFNNPTSIGTSTFLPLTVSVPSNIQGGNYKIRVRYGGFISVNSYNIFVNNPSTYNLSGTIALNDGQSTNINLNFTGTGPYNYVLSNGLSGVATTNPWQITVSPDQSTVYSVNSASNVCGTSILNGNNSAIVSVNFTKQFVTCFPFNANANDEKNNNTATVNGPILADNRYGQTNAAYSFNGTSNYIEYSTNLLRKREYTMSAWVLMNNLPSSTQYILSQGETGTNTFQGLGVNSSGWFLQSYTNNGVYSVSSTTGFAANQWIHLTAVCSYQSLKLYINGNLISSALNSSIIPFKTSDIGRIGANSSSLDSFFGGKIDDVRLYKGALNDDEVYALFNNTNNCPIVENTSIIVVRSLSPTSVCAGNNVSVAYSLSNVNVSAGSPLNVLLSDQYGSFANPTIVGSGSSSPITATVPLNTVNSNFYRIRLVSTSGTPVNSVNSSTLVVSGSKPTATISGGGSIQNGQSANLTITFAGTAPYTYALNNGVNQTTSTSPLILPVSPFSTTTYTVTSLSNSCGIGTSSGSATVTVAPYIGLGLYNTSICTGTNNTITFQANFTPNNNFRVELSDAVGSFSSPTNIGVGTISPITFLVPNSVTNGTGYKIRLVSDSPAATSVVSSALTINQRATATISGTTTINEGQSTNLTISFTGQGPWTYSITGGTSQTTISNPVTISVLPAITTTYTVTSISNTVCGTGTALGSAVITVNPVPVRLISCFPFNGNANDGKGLNNGTVNGATLTTDRFGNANSAYMYDFSFTSIETNSVINIQNPSFTYSIWIKPSSSSSNVFEQPFPIISIGGQILVLNKNGNNYSIYYSGDNSTINAEFSLSNFVLEQWYHLCFVRNGGNILLYNNGILIGNVTRTNINATYTASPSLTIGMYANYSFNGKIDDVQIYKGALSLQQIQVLYNSNDGCFDASMIPVLDLQSLSSSTFCKGQNISVPFGSANVINPIKVQLSDASGSFASPIEIGSGSTSPIAAIIPANQAVGTAYKIRLVSSDNVPIISNVVSNIVVKAPITATITGTATINEGQPTNLTINFTGGAPYTYTITDGTSQTTNTNPLTISVTPLTTKTYTITSLTNSCGNGISTGSAIITVNPVAVRLVSCFPFTGNANDSKGLNNGTIYGASLTPDRFGNANSAYYFDGEENSGINFPMNGIKYQSNTISAWIKPTVLAFYTGYFSISLISNEPTQRPKIQIFADIDRYLFFENSDLPNLIKITNQPLNLEQWYHIAISSDISNYKIYLNGNLVYSGNYNFNGANLEFANNSIGNFGNGSQGNLDDVQIYKGVLTAGQVQALYSNTNACFDATTYTCLSNMTYNSMLGGQQVLQVSNQIIGSNIIQTNSRIHFDSKNAVLLQPGFKTDANTVFKATVGGGCTN